MKGNRWVKVALVIAVLVALEATLGNRSLINPYYTRIAILSCFAVMLAVSLNIINGYAGQFSIGHAGFYAIGAYSAGAFTYYGGPALESVMGAVPELVSHSLLLLAAIAIGTFCAALAGVAVGIPSLRLRGDYLAIATLGFGEMVRVALRNVEAVGGARGFSGIPLYSTIFWIGLFTVLIIWLSRNLLNSKQGRALQALRDDETAASAVGINITRYKVVAFVISSAMAGTAGALYAHYEGYLQPDSFDFMRSIEIIIIVAIGGLGSTTGAVAAAVLLTILPEMLRASNELRMVIYSGLLVLFMLVRPQGMLGRWELSWDAVRRRKKETSGGLT